jgi:hypothetical protein
MPFPVITQVKAKVALLVARLRGRGARAVAYGDLTGLYVAEDLTLPEAVIDDFMPTAPRP